MNRDNLMRAASGVGSRGAADRAGPEYSITKRHRGNWGHHQCCLGMGGHSKRACGSALQVSQRDSAADPEPEAGLPLDQCIPEGTAAAR